MKGYYKFTDTEIKKLMKENLLILYDTREHKNKNDHILEYFDKNKISYKKQKVDEGDYTAIIKKRPDMGVYRDLYFPIAVERKDSVNELVGNLTEETDTRDDVRLIRELHRAKMKGIKISLLIEEKNAIEKIKRGDYISLMKPPAVIGRLSSIQDLYLQDTIFTDKSNSGFEIYRKLYYGVRNCLKELDTTIAPIEYEEIENN